MQCGIRLRHSHLRTVTQFCRQPSATAAAFTQIEHVLQVKYVGTAQAALVLDTCSYLLFYP